MSSFRPIAQPNRPRPHVEIRSPTVDVVPLEEAQPNAFAQGASVLQKALAEREIEKRRAASAADPWNGMRDTQSPAQRFGARLGDTLRPNLLILLERRNGQQADHRAADD